MDDLEITKACAKAMDLPNININSGEVVIGVTPNRYVYKPLTNDAQAMALVKRFRLEILYRAGLPNVRTPLDSIRFGFGEHADLNHAICECVAQMPSPPQSAEPPER